MNLLEAIRGRRAVRDFTAEPVSQQAIRQMVMAASWAPSAMNDQPWRFTVVTDTEVLDDISTRAKAWALAHMPALRQPAHFQDLLTDTSFHMLHHAPVLVVISVPAGQEWATEDCALAAQNLMLAAVELGLGSCWIGFAQGWIASEEGRSLLGLSPDRIVVAPIAIGHPKAPAPPVPRKAVALSWIGNADVSPRKKIAPWSEERPAAAGL
jgi:nitroreductase